MDSTGFSIMARKKLHKSRKISVAAFFFGSRVANGFNCRTVCFIHHWYCFLIMCGFSWLPPSQHAGHDSQKRFWVGNSELKAGCGK
jgi:hypothetical protein